MQSLVLIAAIVAVFLTWRGVRKRQLLRRLGPEFEEYNRHAFKTIVTPSDDEKFEIIDRLASEFRSRSGQLAISVQAQGYSAAFHHINKDGSFSAKGPYFVSRHTRNWLPSKRVHLVRFLRGRGSWGFQSSNPQQTTGLIKERGVAVLEFDTKRYPPADIWDFAEIHKKEREKWTLIDR